MPPAVIVLNAGAYVRPSKFKSLLQETGVSYKDIAFGCTSQKFIQLSFDTVSEAAEAHKLLKPLTNFRGEPLKVRMYEDYTLWEPKKHHVEAKHDEESSSSEVGPENVYFGAPFYDPAYNGEPELLCKQKFIRNQVKHQFMRILKGQTLASAGAPNTPALQALKKQPAYLRDPILKEKVMILPQVQTCALTRNYRTKSEFLLSDGKIGAFYRMKEDLLCFSATETAQSQLHPVEVTTICEAMEQLQWGALYGFILFRSAGEVQDAVFRVEQILMSIKVDGIDDCLLQELQTLQQRFPVIKRLEINGMAFGAPCIVQRLFGVEFGISTEAFFQVNLAAAHLLFEHVSNLIPESATCVLDGCCGCGVVGLCARASLLARGGRDLRIIGIDICEQSIISAREAAEKQRACAQYIVGPLESNLQAVQQCDCAVFDPPRGGLHPSVPKAVRASQLDLVIYVSCSPKSLGRDLFDLCAESGSKKNITQPFYVDNICGFNSFPGCQHVETVVCLKRWHGE